MAPTTSTVAVAIIFSTLAMALCASSQSDGCETVIYSLAPCISYINGNTTKVSHNCCGSFSDFVHNTPGCLCAVITGGSNRYGIVVNQTQAMSLPGACKIDTHKQINHCLGINNAAMTNSRETYMMGLLTILLPFAFAVMTIF